MLVRGGFEAAQGTVSVFDPMIEAEIKKKDKVIFHSNTIADCDNTRITQLNNCVTVTWLSFRWLRLKFPQ